MPDVVTHRYDPAIGVGPNLCALGDFEALRVLDGLRRTCRPTLKPDYLARRRATEQWLAEAASRVLRRHLEHLPGYFFLGDFSHMADLSRPASLVVPLTDLPADAITFTLGDSMTVAEQADRRVHSMEQVAALFAAGDAVAGFGLSDRGGFQRRFIEVQVWDGGLRNVSEPHAAENWRRERRGEQLPRSRGGSIQEGHRPDPAAG